MNREDALNGIMYTTRASCRLCSGSLRIVLSLPDTPLANSYALSQAETQHHYPLYLSQCDACGHVQLPIVADPSVLFQEYPYTSSTAASFRQHVGKLADEVGGIGGLLVDIGSNDGLLLSEAQKRGMRTLGIDPARNLAAEATQRGQLTLPAFLTPEIARQVRQILGQPCTVTALNVFAHADDLDSIAKAVYELINPSGTFIFEVAYLLDVLEKNEIGTIYHEHTSHHHVEPLVRFFRRHGLGLFRVDRIPSQGGSIRGYVRANGIAGPSVDVLLGVEREVIPPLLKNWPQRVRDEHEAFNEMTEPYRGKGLAIYGAPARLTTYAYTMGLLASDVSCVFDDEPRKIGRFTPGLRWPIVPSSELMARNPPAVLVAAWPYLADIQKRFPDYAGKWLVPPRSA